MDELRKAVDEIVDSDGGVSPFNAMVRKLMDDHERLEDALDRIENWCKAYPISVFLPVPDEKMKMVQKFCEMNNISFGGLHAQWARHILSGIGDIIDITRKE